jgi:RNA polymerase sigma-70 factor (ECF subfamily)
MLFSRKNAESKKQDQASIGALYDKHASWLLGVCIQYMGNLGDAEDVLHDGFLKIIASIGSFQQRPQGSLEAWMRRIIVNTALKNIRDHKKDRMTTDLDRVLESTPDHEDHDEFEGYSFSREQLMHSICELPIGYRTVFNLYVMEEFTHKQIGELLGISENTSKSQLSKARNFLRKRLLEYQMNNSYEKAESSR